MIRNIGLVTPIVVAMHTITPRTEKDAIAPCWDAVLFGRIEFVGPAIVLVCWVKGDCCLGERAQSKSGVVLHLFDELIMK